MSRWTEEERSARGPHAPRSLFLYSISYSYYIIPKWAYSTVPTLLTLVTLTPPNPSLAYMVVM